jgi:hypothetical protein
MSDMLTSDPNWADALLDVSNILRNTRLGGHGPADLVRLERVGEALATLYGATEIAMFGVADSNLLTQSGLFLDSWQRRVLRGWVESRLIFEAGKADIPLLQMAEETGLPIITGDRFGGHRREFPWLDGSDDAVLEPQVDRYGGVSLRHVTLTPKADWEMSVSEERDLLVQQGLGRRTEILDRYWSCPEPRCARHDPTISSFVLLPVERGHRLICDQHGLVMTDMGPRPRVAQLKIMKDGREQHRFSVTRREPVIVGRTRGPGDLSPFIDETILRRVSRTHLRFDLDSDRLTITDLSRHGTALILRNGTRIDLRHVTTHSFTVGDRAQIHPSVEIIRSGRRYPSELSGPRRILHSPGGSDPAPPTQWL